MPSVAATSRVHSSSFRRQPASARCPSADLCLKIARCHDRLDSLDEAFTWLARVVDAPDSFLAWSSAASALARLTERTRPPARAHRRLAVTGSYTTSQLAAMLPLAALRQGVGLRSP